MKKTKCILFLALTTLLSINIPTHAKTTVKSGFIAEKLTNMPRKTIQSIDLFDIYKHKFTISQKDIAKINLILQNLPNPSLMLNVVTDNSKVGKKGYHILQIYPHFEGNTPSNATETMQKNFVQKNTITVSFADFIPSKAIVTYETEISQQS